MTLKTYQADFQGWNGYYLENEFIRLVAVPDIGGRIMAYNLADYEYFFVDRDLAGKLFTAEENQGDGSLAAWKNYGGDKTWPAPQGWDTDQQWHGPPDPVLDTGRYTVERFEVKDNRAIIQMVSPPDERTGVQITRQFSIFGGSSRVAVHLAFHNIKKDPIRWSIWDVAQLRAERAPSTPDKRVELESSVMITTPINPNSKFDNGYYVMFGAEDNPQWQVNQATGLLEASYDWHIGKIGLDSDAGWIAFVNPAAGYAFAETFDYDPDGDYPDNGATVEVWTIGAGQVANLNYGETDIYLMETEILSPFKTIQPDQSASFDIQWGVCRASGKILDVNPGGMTVQPLTLQNTGQLTGEFGVFDKGKLHLAWYDAQNNSLSEAPLMNVDPLMTLKIEQDVTIPAEASACELFVVAADGERRSLACAEVSA